MIGGDFRFKMAAKVGGSYAAELLVNACGGLLWRRGRYGTMNFVTDESLSSHSNLFVVDE